MQHGLTLEIPYGSTVMARHSGESVELQCKMLFLEIKVDYHIDSNQCPLWTHIHRSDANQSHSIDMISQQNVLFANRFPII